LIIQIHIHRTHCQALCGRVMGYGKRRYKHRWASLKSPERATCTRCIGKLMAEVLEGTDAKF
jgi:hypothetical protein